MVVQFMEKEAHVMHLVIHWSRVFACNSGYGIDVTYGPTMKKRSLRYDVNDSDYICAAAISCRIPGSALIG
jgi:hypothetical protein